MENKKEFLEEYLQLCQKYNLIIEPDEILGYCVNPFKEYWIEIIERMIERELEI